jgi:hypothetical protein
MLFLGGSFNAIFGLAAIFNDKVLTRVGGALLFWDYTTWGWIHLISGILMLVASFGLFAGRPGAARLAILFAALNAIAQISWITVNPTWTLIVVALDVIVIYQLSARPQPAP